MHHIDENGKEHYWTKQLVLQELGFPVISKQFAHYLDMMQNPSPRNAHCRQREVCENVGGHKVAKRWIEKFYGYENENWETDFQVPPFKVSSKCCYYLKEKPCDKYQKEHNSAPFMGLMASEGGRRSIYLKQHGCNYFGVTTARSCPFAIFTRQDLLQLALELKVPVPEIYGTIERKEDGTLYTTGVQRTGCNICGFGVHLEKRPHRFDKLLECNPNAWHFWMYDCCTDEHGEKYGWARVLDYIDVKYNKPEKSE